MSPVVQAIILAVVLILAGLVMCLFHAAVGKYLGPVVKVSGIILIVVGLLILLMPVLIYIYHHIMAAMGIEGGGGVTNR